MWWVFKCSSVIIKLNILIWLIEMFQFCLLPCPTNHSSVLVWFTLEYQQNNGYDYHSRDIIAVLVKIFHFLGSAFQKGRWWHHRQVFRISFNWEKPGGIFGFQNMFFLFIYLFLDKFTEYGIQWFKYMVKNNNMSIKKFTDILFTWNESYYYVILLHCHFVVS